MKWPDDASNWEKFGRICWYVIIFLLTALVAFLVFWLMSPPDHQPNIEWMLIGMVIALTSHGVSLGGFYAGLDRTATRHKYPGRATGR
jgi:Kef-type K+ transport system membrane component KefB